MTKLNNVREVRADGSIADVGQVDIYNNTRTMRDNTGRLVTMDLGAGDVHIDSALANVAFGYKLADGIADMVCPVIPTSKASDKYWMWDKDDALQPAQDLLVAPGGSVHEVSARLSNSTFSTAPYALQGFVPTEVEANADSPLRPQLAVVKRLMSALMIGREQRVAAMLRLATNYATAYKATIGAGAKWNGGASSNPVQDLYTQIEAALMPITDIVMSERTWHDFVQNAAVQKYVASKVMTPGANPIPNAGQSSGFSALLGLPQIHVAAMKSKDTTGAYSYVWGNDVVLLHRPQNLPADGQDIATAYTYRWTGANDTSDMSMQGGFFVRTYFDPKRGPRGGTVIIAGHNDAEVFTSDAVSGLLVSAHQ